MAVIIANVGEFMWGPYAASGLREGAEEGIRAGAVL